MLNRKGKFVKLRKRNIFIRFFAGVLLVSTVSVIFLAAFIAQWFQGNMMSDMGKMKKQELFITGTTFQEYINRCQHFAMVLYKNANLKTVMLSQNTEWTSSYSHAVSQVQNILILNPFINSIYVVNPSGIAFFVSNDTEDEASQQQLLGHIQSNQQMGDPIVWEMKAVSGRTIPTMTVYFRENISGNGMYRGAIAVNIDLEALQENMFAGQLDNDQKVMIVDRDGNSVIRSSSQASFLEQEYAQRILQSEASEDVFQTHVNGQNVFVSYLAINDGKFLIVSEMGYYSSIQTLIDGRNQLFLACGCIILIIIGASFVVSHMAYRPIGNVYNNMRALFHMPELEEEEKNSEVLIMTKTMTKVAEQMNSLEKQNISNTIAGLLRSPADQAPKVPADYFVKSGILPAADAPYLLAVLRIDHYHCFKQSNSAEAKAFQITSISTLSMEYFQDTAMCTAYQTAKDTIALILSGKTPEDRIQPEEALAGIRELQGVIKEGLGIEITVGLSGVAAGPQELNALYLRVYEVTKSKLLYESGHLFDCSARGAAGEPPALAKEMEPALQAVKKGSIEEFRARFEEFLLLCRQCDYERTIQALSQFAVSMSKISGKVAGLSAQEPSYLSIYEELSKIWDYDELLDWFCQLYHKVNTTVNDANSKKVHDIVTDSISIILENYSDPQMSVNSMAERLSISAGYFSRIFNEMTGCTFPDYVNNLRLEKAWEMLQSDKSASIREISKRVGYSSESYFSSSFKKKYGVSPSKCRLNNQNP